MPSERLPAASRNAGAELAAQADDQHVAHGDVLHTPLAPVNRAAIVDNAASDQDRIL